MNYFLLSLLLLTGTVQATQALIEFKSPEQQALFKELTHELRCPKCQNQNIADSNAVVAVDMRAKTLELVQQGQNKEQVLDYMINRYGDFVHYLPPVNRYTLWLWLLPLLMLLVLIAVGVFRRSQQSKQPVQDITGNTAAELDQLIARYRSKK